MFIAFAIGLVIGGCLGVTFVALLNVNRSEETENEMREAYKSGYTNGYEAAKKQYETI